MKDALRLRAVDTLRLRVAVAALRLRVAARRLRVADTARRLRLLFVVEGAARLLRLLFVVLTLRRRLDAAAGAADGEPAGQCTQSLCPLMS